MGEQIAKTGASLQLETPLRVADVSNSGSMTGQEVDWVLALLPRNYKPPTAKGSFVFRTDSDVL